MLTTNKNFVELPLTTFWATSPATAQAAGMAAQILSHNPELWPETVRALIVHSARWTPAMLRSLRECRLKKERTQLARQFGYGVPDLARALASAKNDVALISQTTIRPYRRKTSDAGEAVGKPTFNEAHYFKLPWPKVALEALGEHTMRLKVTLSYFIEPSPGDTAPIRPAKYQSFGLRYELKRPRETTDDFFKRINQLAQESVENRPTPRADPDTNWMFGSRSVTAGSLHCDIWEGPAIQLAARDLIAIYPVAGWWRERTKDRSYAKLARYSLVLSMDAGEVEVDLYTEIDNQVNVGIEAEIIV